MKNQQTLKVQTGYFPQHNLFNFSKLCIRIKKNEGYSNKPYKDQLGYYTIGYGHLIKKNENFLFKKTQSKNFFNKIFLKDLNKATQNFKRHYNIKKIPNNVQEVIIEMIFQLGIKKVLKFYKFNKYIKNNQFYMAALEMIDSRWYTQTPTRTNLLITTMLCDND